MREILFRGKRLDNGEWVEGFCYKGEKSGAFMLQPYIRIARNGKDVIGESFHLHKVDSATVGQYTGLTDKNGKKIFEGDILPIWENGEEYYYKVIYNADCFMLAMLDSVQGGYPLSIKHNQTEVIGNIYDNPELLEE